MLEQINSAAIRSVCRVVIPFQNATTIIFYELAIIGLPN